MARTGARKYGKEMRRLLAQMRCSHRCAARKDALLAQMRCRCATDSRVSSIYFSETDLRNKRSHTFTCKYNVTFARKCKTKIGKHQLNNHGTKFIGSVLVDCDSILINMLLHMSMFVTVLEH